MKKIIITKAEQAVDIGDPNPKLTGFEIFGPEEMKVSDGYHTFDELYEHRNLLFIALCKAIHTEALRLWRPEKMDFVDYSMLEDTCWRSKLHYDGSSFNNWFILGIGKEPKTQISYHLPLSKWEETDFAETLDKAPEWDGHTSDDVLERLIKLI